MRTAWVIIFFFFAVIAAGFLWTPAIAQTQTPSSFLTVQKVTSDPVTSKLRVIVKNVGNQKVTGWGLMVSSQQYTQELFYNIGMESKLALPRPSGFGGIQPGESLEVLFPLSPDGALTAKVNAVILEDRTALGGKTEVAAMFRYRRAYASEWARWALAMQPDPARPASPAVWETERAELIRVLGDAPDDGDAETVAGQRAARETLRTLLKQTTPENRASLLAYVQERAASLKLHAQRAGVGATSAPAAAGGANVSGGGSASLRPIISKVTKEDFSCDARPGQSFGVAGHSDVLDAEGGKRTARARSTAKGGGLAAVAMGACGVENSVPRCAPQFFTSTSSSPSSATITGASTTYLAGVGCAVSASQTHTVVNAAVSHTELQADTGTSSPCCVVPTLETTQGAGPSAIYPTASDFNMTISDPNNDSFDGMTVGEQSGGAGTNTCYWEASGVANGNPNPQVSGGWWTVAGNNVAGQHNHWGYDTIGYTNSGYPSYVRQNGPPHGVSLPCTITSYQDMVISCSDDTDWNYTSDVLTITVNRAKSVTNCRAGVCQTINGY